MAPALASVREKMARLYHWAGREILGISWAFPGNLLERAEILLGSESTGYQEAPERARMCLIHSRVSLQRKKARAVQRLLRRAKGFSAYHGQVEM
jgi:hypothetical protein